MTLLNELPPTDAESASRETEYSDSACTGLRVIVNRKGIKRFLFRYNYQGKKRSMMIGEFGAFDVKSARLKINELKRLLADDLDPKAERDSKRNVVTFLEFAQEHYIPNAKANKLTYQNDISIMTNHFYPLWKDWKLSEISKQDIQRLMDSHAGKLKPSTINRMLSLIHRMLKLACEWGHLTVNPASNLKKLKENNQRNFFLNSEQVARLLKSCDEDLNKSAANFVRLALLTGMRAGEILSSKWEHVKFNDGEPSLYLPHTKAGLARSVPLNDSALAIIEAQKLLMRSNNPYLFAGRFGSKQMSHPKKPFNRIKERAGDLEQLRIHDLRHSFASILINSSSENGGVPVSLYDVQHLLGHHTSKTTERYAHLASSRLRAVSGNVSSFVSNAISTT
tara:strand:+ start:426 stop:1607 length:1182 start_codon:yes stop_codon:yes gene_type:complete